MAEQARINHVLVDVDKDVAVRITAPRGYTDGEGKPGKTPWVVYLGRVMSIETDHRDALVALRDALSAALAAHPVEPAAGGEG